MILWKVYALISLAKIVFLMLGGVSFYDAVYHVFTIVPTGGWVQ